MRSRLGEQHGQSEYVNQDRKCEGEDADLADELLITAPFLPQPSLGADSIHLDSPAHWDPLGRDEPPSDQSNTSWSEGELMICFLLGERMWGVNDDFGFPQVPFRLRSAVIRATQQPQVLPHSLHVASLPEKSNRTFTATTATTLKLI